MKVSKRRTEGLTELATDSNTAPVSNYTSVNQISALQTKIQNLEMSLDMSLKNQKLLQDSLEYMLALERSLRKELEEKEASYENRIKYLEKQLNKKLNESESVCQSMKQVKQLLEQSQEALQAAQAKISEQDSLINKKEGSIRELKKTIEQLESQKLYSNLSRFNNVAKQANEDLIYEVKQSYEKRIHELEFQLKRLENTCCSEKSKADRLEKELNEFKRWLCGLVGIEKVVSGCEKMIMKEVTKRLTQ